MTRRISFWRPRGVRDPGLVGMAFYFRTWKMSLASIAGLFFTVVVVTVGLYAPRSARLLECNYPAS